MSKIKIEALGGMGENGKNMYLVEIDDKIFILDAGLIYPNIDLYGIDAIVPNIEYLKENKHRIKGIFISHGHEDHIGALPYLLKNISTKVYGTHFTISLIEEMLTKDGMNISDYKLFKVNERKRLNFGDVQIAFYKVNHALPDSANIVIHTKDGAIVYATDFNFSHSLNDKYKVSYDKLLELAKNNVLAVMAESVGINDTNRATTNQKFELMIYNTLSKFTTNIYIACYSTDLSRIQKIADIAASLGKKIAFFSKKSEQIIKTALATNYLTIKEENLVELDGSVKENLVVFIVGNFTDPYHIISKALNNQIRTIKIKEEDLIIGLSDPVSGSEKYYLSVLDEIYRHDINFLPIENKNIRTTHATREDLIQLYAITKPKYVIPIKGEVRHLSRHYNLINELSLSDQMLDICDGRVVVINDGNFLGYEEIKIEQVYVNGSLTGSVNDEIVNERNLLATDGVVEIIVYIDSKNKKIVKDATIITKGFVYAKVNETDLDMLKQIVARVVEAYFNKKKLNVSDVEASISHEAKKFIHRVAKTPTTILPIVIDLKNIKY